MFTKLLNTAPWTLEVWLDVLAVAAAADALDAAAAAAGDNFKVVDCAATTPAHKV